MNKMELELTMSESMSEQARSELKAWFEEFIRQCEVPPPIIVVKDGSTTVLITWVLAGAGLVAAGCLTKVGETFASWLMDYFSQKKNLPSQQSNILAKPILPPDLKYRTPLDDITSPFNEALSKSKNVTLRRIDTVYDAASRQKQIKEQRIEFRDGELRDATESLKTLLNVSENDEE